MLLMRAASDVNKKPEEKPEVNPYVAKDDFHTNF